MTIDDNSRIFLQNSLRNGSAILFTGAGFSSLAANSAGVNLPRGDALRDELWKIAFPSDPVDGSSLAEVFDAAMRLHPKQTRAVLVDRLTVDASMLPDLYANYLSLPWYRLYTLNIDDLVGAAQRRFDLGQEFRTLSGMTEAVPSPDVLSAVHLNGLISALPNVTFSPPQYGERAARPNDAYATLIRDLRSHPVIFVGTQLDEPPLWHHLALRGEPPSGRELRPKSFLVVPSLPRARAVLLDRLNIRHLPMTTEEFHDEFVAPAAAERHKRPHMGTSPRQPLDRVALVLADAAPEPADFLLGREPTWGDINGGFAVERTFEENLLDAAKATTTRVVAISATSGAGKSTVMRRLAMSLQIGGEEVAWLRPDASQSVAQIRAAVVAGEYGFLFIDRAERFGERGLELIRGLAELPSGPRVVASYGASAFDELNVELRLSGIDIHTAVLPRLDDHDIHLLIDALTRGHRLGRLAGMSIDQQVKAFEERASRQLLVAMIEATSGERFEEKIANECRELSADLVPAYAIVVLATTLRFSVRVDDVLAALSDVTPQGIELLDRLSRQHLVLKSNDGTLAARHAVIAREVSTHLRRSGQLAPAIARLAFVIASRIHPEMSRNAPERRILNTLVNHEYLGQNVDSPSQAREIYADVEGLLGLDAHFWLQRGSYELERGDIGLAENFLAQARGYAPDDFMVETEWSYLLMQKACRVSSDTRAREWMDEAITTLFDIITQRGAKSAKTYVVLAQQVLRWAAAASLSVDERKALFLGVRSVMSDGMRFHTGNRQFVAARNDLERAYLELATIK